MLVRNYEFLKNKYREMLLPTVLMAISDKLCIIIDMMLGCYFVAPAAASSFTLVNPFVYICTVFYTLFGQGGSLLALRAKSLHDDEKANFYFTVSLLSMILIVMVYIIIVFFFTKEIFVNIFHVPQAVLPTALIYAKAFVFFMIFSSYMIFMSYFARSDGYPRLPLYSFLIANISNLTLSFIFMSVFHMGAFGSALGTVIAFAMGSIYMSTYFFKENRNFYLIPAVMSNVSTVGNTIKQLVLNTPEIIGRIFIAFKSSFYLYLCSTHVGVVGLLAYVVYDNSETLFFMILSGIMRVVTPIVTVFYKEKDYESVLYIIRRSIKEVLILSILAGVIICIIPEWFIRLFSITNPEYVKYISLALRITATGLVGRSLSLLLIFYAQAIERNKISSIMSLSEEFLLALISGVVLTHFFGGMGIWYSIVLADTIPIAIYLVYVLYQRSQGRSLLDRFFLLDKSEYISWTYIRGTDYEDYDVDEQTKEFLSKLNELFGDNLPVVDDAVKKLSKRILDSSEIDSIDYVIRYVGDEVTFTLTYEGKLLNPIRDEDIKSFEKINGSLDYAQVLGFNRTYMNVPV